MPSQRQPPGRRRRRQGTDRRPGVRKLVVDVGGIDVAEADVSATDLGGPDDRIGGRAAQQRRLPLPFFADLVDRAAVGAALFGHAGIGRLVFLKCLKFRRYLQLSRR